MTLVRNEIKQLVNDAKPFTEDKINKLNSHHQKNSLAEVCFTIQLS
jgi:hypothetical protein